MPPYPYDYPQPPRGHRNSYHLNPDDYGGDPGLYRSNSRGRPGGPAEIHIHNDMYQEGPYADNRDYAMPSPPNRGRSPGRGYYDPAYGYPMPMMMQPPPPPHLIGSRSRSRGRDDDERYRDRVIDDWKEQEKEREKSKERAIEEHELEKKKEKEEEKQKMADAVRKHEQDKKDEEEKQKKAWEEYEAKRKAKEQKEKEEKEKADEEYRERLRKHLSNLGYSQKQIDAMIEKEKKKAADGSLVRVPSNQKGELVLTTTRSPIYPKIRRTDIAVETLKFYDLKWRYDETDSEFIIILQEMSERETDVLFAHTARLREKGKATVLQIEDKGKGKKPQYVMVRRRSRSRGKSPSGAERLAEHVLRGSPE